MTSRLGTVSPALLTVLLLCSGAFAGTEPTVTLMLDDASLTEGDPGAAAQFTVSRSGSTSGGLLVQFLVQPESTATVGTDFDSDQLARVPFQPSIRRQVVFDAGVASVVVELEALADNRVEPGEEAVLAVMADEDYTIAPGSEMPLTFALVDDPPVATVTVSPLMLLEGGASAVLELSRSGGDLSTQLGTRVDLTGGTAQAGLNDFDVEGVNGNYDFAAVFIPGGSASVQREVVPQIDNEIEGEESIVFELVASGSSNNSYLIQDGTAVVALVDDAAAVRVDAIDPVGSETGDPAVFRISRSGGDIDDGILIGLQLGGTATPPGDPSNQDYDPIPSLSANDQYFLSAGNSSVDVIIAPRFDLNELEPDETVTLTVVPGDEYAIEPGADEASVTILNLIDLIHRDDFETQP